MNYTRLNNDICRCHGQMGNYTCPKRDNCLRYMALENDKGERIIQASFICLDEGFLYYIPCVEVDDETT